MESMLSCKDEKRGCFVAYCKKCNQFRIISFGCNSRLCTSCGKRHTDRWAEMLANKVKKGIMHRHLVFSLPVELREPIKKNRSLQKIISDAAFKAIQKTFSSMKKKKIIPGVIGVVHPFGKDLKFNPHVHCIVTEGGFDDKGIFVQLGQYVPYNLIHKIWQNEVLTSLKKYLPKEFIDFLFRKYPKGFAAYVKPERIFSSKGLARYVGRYVRHPAIANSRIIGYNGEAVKFFYADHEKKMHRIIMVVDEFISAIIQHIPEKNFRMIRYYGMYSRRKIRKVNQSIIMQKILINFDKKREFHCPTCNEIMEIVWYCEKPPPKNMNEITSWLENK